jgi:hypothetical protein
MGTRATICLAGIVGFSVVTTTYVRNTERRRLS